MGATMSPAELDALVDERLAALVAAGALTRRPLQPTERGRDQLRRELGVAHVPTWDEVRDRIVPGRALGLPRVTADDLQAEIFARLLGRAPDAMGRMVDDVVASELGLGGKPTLARIRAHLLARRLKLDTRADEPKDVIARAVSVAMKTQRADARTLRPALVRRWLAEEPVLGDGPPATEPPAAPGPPPAVPWTEATLISAVPEVIARIAPPGRFGDDKVFVAALWRQLRDSRRFPGLTLDELKTHLVAASQQRQLTLARADLVGAMDPAELAASEIRVRSATFHFVVDRSRA